MYGHRFTSAKRQPFRIVGNLAFVCLFEFRLAYYPRIVNRNEDAFVGKGAGEEGRHSNNDRMICFFKRNFTIPVEMVRMAWHTLRNSRSVCIIHLTQYCIHPPDP